MQIAIENLGVVLSTPEQLNAVIDALDPEYYVALIDVGHSSALSSGIAPETFLRKVTPGRVQGLHIHDNNGLEDQHLPPYFGIIKWDYVMEALKEIGYDGDFTLELAPFFRKKFEPDLIPSMLRFLVESARYMIGKI